MNNLNEEKSVRNNFQEQGIIINFFIPIGA